VFGELGSQADRRNDVLSSHQNRVLMGKDFLRSERYKWYISWRSKRATKI